MSVATHVGVTGAGRRRAAWLGIAGEIHRARGLSEQERRWGLGGGGGRRALTARSLMVVSERERGHRLLTHGLRPSG
jgi:hypothetical protein